MLRSAHTVVPSIAILFAGVVSAQHAGQTLPPAWYRELPAGLERRPRVEVVYDVRSDRITSVTQIPPDVHAVDNEVCFDNSEAVGPWVVSDPGVELVDWGIKNCRKVNRVSRIRIPLVTTALEVAAGGPGGTFSLALYSGTRGFGRLGTEVFRHTFTGLPGRPANGDYGFPTLLIDFGAEPLDLTDGMLGWGVLQLDGLTGPLLVRAPNSAAQTADALDTYSPGPARAATYVGTFNYGTVCTCASLSIQIEEIESTEVAHTTVLDGSGVNPSILAELLPPRIGQTFAAFVNTGTTSRTLLFASSAPLAPTPSAFGEILIDPTRPLTRPIPGLGSYAVPIPSDLALIGTAVYLQAAIVPPSVARMTLTNGLRLRLGY